MVATLNGVRVIYQFAERLEPIFQPPTEVGSRNSYQCYRWMPTVKEQKCIIKIFLIVAGCTKYPSTVLPRMCKCPCPESVYGNRVTKCLAYSLVIEMVAHYSFYSCAPSNGRLGPTQRLVPNYPNPCVKISSSASSSTATVHYNLASLQSSCDRYR